MKYYLIAGEASGDLHASHLMAALREQDPRAQFRCFGGDLMQAQGGELVCHYRDIAYMGFVQVALHARTILGALRRCREDILRWWPDVVILVDYPGFNLKVARFVKEHSRIPVYYYISPKIWAWKEYRIRQIHSYVDHLFSILPFEVPFYEQKHGYPIHYVGNPSVDEVAAYVANHPADADAFRRDCGLDNRPIIALLAGSRRQEVADNLPRMIEAARPLAGRYQLVLAAAPGLEEAFYKQWLVGQPVAVVRQQTFRLLQYSTAALVTSGTATLEAALFRVPQVVCYYMRMGRIVSFGRRFVLKIPYISLVNLIADSPVVPELVADGMTPANVRRHLAAILPGGGERQAQLEGYERMARALGPAGAPQRAAELMVSLLQKG